MLDNYTVSLYIRLSTEDENEGESNSIKNQRDLLMAFIAKHPELSSCNIVEFCDDGHSGVNFDRPSVKKMLEKVRNGEIHCILSKIFRALEEVTSRLVITWSKYFLFSAFVSYQ